MDSDILHECPSQHVHNFDRFRNRLASSSHHNVSHSRIQKGHACNHIVHDRLLADSYHVWLLLSVFSAGLLRENCRNPESYEPGRENVASVSPTVFHMLERLVGKRVLAVINRDFGYEGRLAVVSHEPPGIWLTEAEAVILRSTIVSPIPQVVSRESKGETFLHLDSVQRLETVPEAKTNARR